MDLKEKYPTSKYAPKADCRHCKGTGERRIKDGSPHPCICIFVSHDVAEEYGSKIGEWARRELRRMNKEV